MIAGEAEAGNAPAGNVAKLQVAANSENFGKRRAACIGCTENAADARAGDVCDGNAILFEDLQDAEVGKPSGKSAAEGKTDARTRFCGACLCFAADWDFAIHEDKDAGSAVKGQW